MATSLFRFLPVLIICPRYFVESLTSNLFAWEYSPTTVVFFVNRLWINFGFFLVLSLLLPEGVVAKEMDLSMLTIFPRYASYWTVIS